LLLYAEYSVFRYIAFATTPKIGNVVVKKTPKMDSHFFYLLNNNNITILLLYAEDDGVSRCITFTTTTKIGNVVVARHQKRIIAFFLPSQQQQYHNIVAVCRGWRFTLCSLYNNNHENGNVTVKMR
jgi:hypothetical protein